MSSIQKYNNPTTKALEETLLIRQQSAVLIFGAHWSGNTEIMNSMMERVCREFPNKLHFFQIDVDDYPDITAFFGVKSVPTIILLKEAKVIDCINGYKSVQNIRKRIQLGFFDS